MADRLLVWAFRTAWRWLPKVPESTAKRVFNVLADVLWIRNGPDVQLLQRNLARVQGVHAPAVRDLTRTAMRKYADYWRVLFQLSGWSEAEFASRVQIHNRDRVDAALAQGRGVIVASTHSGNWDVGGLAIAKTWGRVTTVAERLKPEELFDIFCAHRAPHGIEILPHRGGARPASEILKERLEAGGLVALVSDRDLSRRGVEVSFFDGTSRMAAGPAALAVATGAILIPCAQWVDGDVAHVLAHAPIDVPQGDPDAVAAVTQRLADVFARDITAHPADWHMLQPIWLEDL